MKVKGLLITFLFMFIAANVFGGGSKDSGRKSKDDRNNTVKLEQMQGRAIRISKKEQIRMLQDQNNDLQRLVNKLKEEIDRFPKPPPIAEVQEQLVPITREIINAVNENDLKLGDLGYYISAPLSLWNHNQGIKGVIDNNGKFILNEDNHVNEVKISSLDKGILERYSRGDKENFVISFPEKNVKLTFERNEQKNSFDLILASDSDKKYSIKPIQDDLVPPQLCIHFNHKFDPDNRIVISSITSTKIAGLQDELKSIKDKYAVLIKHLDNSDLEIFNKNEELKLTKTFISELEEDLLSVKEELKLTKTFISELEENLFSVKNDNFQLKGEFHLLSFQKEKLNGELNAAYAQISELEKALSRIINYPTAQKPETKIMGKGTLDKNDIVAYMRTKNALVSRKDVEAIVDTYIKEAQREHINHDIAIAQMCYATDFLRNQQQMKNHNYAGFDMLNGIPIKYANMNEGIRAHIQHLKGYASCDLPEGKIIDKRYQILIENRTHGTVTTLEALFEKWSPDSAHAYRSKINSILDDLYLY